MSTENKLVKRAKNGDSKAFGELYDSHISPIYRFVLLKVSDKANAEDITQHVFLNAWQNIHKYESRPGIPFSSWLYRIAKNAVIDHYRTSRDHLDIELVSEKSIVALSDESEEKIDNAFQLELVKKSLTHLRDDEQSVVILKFVDGLSTKEVASALEKTQGAIRVIQHRALKKLQKLLGEKNQGVINET